MNSDTIFLICCLICFCSTIIIGAIRSQKEQEQQHAQEKQEIEELCSKFPKLFDINNYTIVKREFKGKTYGALKNIQTNELSWYVPSQGGVIFNHDWKSLLTRYQILYVKHRFTQMYKDILVKQIAIELTKIEIETMIKYSKSKPQNESVVD